MKDSTRLSKVNSKNTSIEMKVRRYLYNKGYRYRVNVSNLPGKPDIVLKKYNTLIFINGCYWHRHLNCKKAQTPITNAEFWQAKFDRNVANDQKHYAELEAQGWNVIVIWECELSRQNFQGTMDRVVYELESVGAND